MSIAISLKRRPEEDEELLLFPETAGLPTPDGRPIQEESWFRRHEEGRLAVDVYETGKELILLSAIAGVKPEHLEVFVHNDMLTVRGKRFVEDVPDGKPLVRECHWGSFSRSIILPTEVDVDGITANLKEGVLTVRLPKIERSKRIKVKESR